MIRALFVCGKGRSRSPTAAQVFAEWDGVATDFGGLSCDADDALSRDQIEWASLILVMEQRHRIRLSERFGAALAGRQIVDLRVPDTYTFMQPELVALLVERAGPHLRRRR
ncbi:MAG: low molecular weight protein tyrosine phosphatase family protein [Paracoccaceae bacterium]